MQIYELRLARILIRAHVRAHANFCAFNFALALALALAIAIAIAFTFAVGLLSFRALQHR
jgi:hypothetical protein